MNCVRNADYSGCIPHSYCVRDLMSGHGCWKRFSIFDFSTFGRLKVENLKSNGTVLKLTGYYGHFVRRMRWCKGNLRSYSGCRDMI